MDEETILVDLGQDTINVDISSDSIVSGTNITNTSTTSNYLELTNKPQINGITLGGNKTSNDLGIEGDINYYHIQSVASAEWIILHNLNKYPSVSIIDSAGDEVIGSIHYDNINQITITFAGAFKGSATLN